MQIKNRSIRKEDNPQYYTERLSELQSIEFENTIYAYSVRSKTNHRNSIKLKEIVVFPHCLLLYGYENHPHA